MAIVDDNCVFHELYEGSRSRMSETKRELV
jgi:hypothetical protein